MPIRKADIFRAGLETLYYSGVYKAFQRNWAGMGAIFMLHHIRPQQGAFDGFHPNSVLEATPEFLDAVLARLKAQGIEFVSFREAVERISEGDTGSRFAAFTIDDGYADNFDQAWPIFRKHDCPFTVFVTTKIVDGSAELWWLALEQIVAENAEVAFRMGETEELLPAATAAEKWDAFGKIYWHFRGITEEQQRRKIRNLCSRYGVSLSELCRAQSMTWEQVRQLHDDPLVTIGAHTVNHFALAKLEENEARHEIELSRDRIERELNAKVEFFCYPYGGPDAAGPREFQLARDAGMRAAVTTRKGLLYPDHAEHLMALPRVSLGGDYESLRYIDLYLSGAPFALWNRFQKVNAA